ncbi:MAG: phosphatase PAP2-related protein, partial [Chitinophagales bacterium]
VLTDIVLQWIRPRDVSLLVFLLIWASFLLLIIRLVADPDLVLLVLWGYGLLTVLRMICIGLVSLNPPEGLIPLADPLTNLFYGRHYITHDLFFSGHTATVCLIFFCLKRRWDKYFTGLATVLTGLFLLIQHVHYSIDVLAAPPVTYAVYRVTRLFTRREHLLLTRA